MRLLAATALVFVVTACSTPTDATGGAGTEVSPTGEQPTVTASVDVSEELLGQLPACPPAGDAAAIEGGLPDVTLACLGPGEAVRLAGLRGTPLIVNVWASWCQPCRTELPALASFSRSAQGEVAVLGIDAADDPQAGAQLWQELDMPFPSVADPDSLTRPGLQWIGLPVTYFVNPDGAIVHRHPGQITEPTEWQDLAREHLGVG